VAIPQIATDLGAGAQDIQWIIDSYILVSPDCCSPQAVCRTDSAAGW
jgi:hypothetical protein